MEASLVVTEAKPMAPTQAVVRALTSSTTPIFLSVVASRASLTTQQASRVLSELLRRKLVSRVKVATPVKYNRWLMSEEQHALYLSRSSVETMKYGPVDKKIDFLMLVRRNPMYSDHPMLKKILDDYQFVAAGA